MASVSPSEDLGRFRPPSAPWRVRVLVGRIASAHATAQLHPTARRLPVKAKHSVWRSAPFRTSTPLRASLDVAPRLGSNGMREPGGAGRTTPVAWTRRPDIALGWTWITATAAAGTNKEESTCAVRGGCGICWLAPR